MQPDYQMTLGLTPILGDHSNAATWGLVRYNLEWTTIFLYLLIIIIGPPFWSYETRGWGDPTPNFSFKKCHNWYLSVQFHHHRHPKWHHYWHDPIFYYENHHFHSHLFDIKNNNILSPKKVKKDIKLAWREWGTKLGIGQSFVICVMLEMWANMKMKNGTYSVSPRRCGTRKCTQVALDWGIGFVY